MKHSVRNYDRPKMLVNCINKRLLESDKPSIFIDSILPFVNFSPTLKFSDYVLTGYDREDLDKIFHNVQNLIEKQNVNHVQSYIAQISMNTRKRLRELEIIKE